MLSLDQRVLLTLAYSDQFQFPLSEQELLAKLIYFNEGIPIKKFSLHQIQAALKNLKKIGLVSNNINWWALRGSEGNFDLRKKREFFSGDKLSSLRALIEFCENNQWIKAVAVTGSVAANNAPKESDVDLMIVTQNDRLWLTRAQLTLHAFLSGRKRVSTHEAANSWCTNLWLSESSLQMPAAKESIYTAYEICHVRWIVDKDKIDRKFMQDNAWVKNFLPNFYAQKIPALASKKIDYSASFWSLGTIVNYVWGVVNWILYLLQHLYMMRHLTREIVDLDRAFFHPRDTQTMVLRNWQKIMENLNTHRSGVVLVTGVFDLLHQEHINFLHKAKEAGGSLVVGVESDVRVKKLKGQGRPIHSERQRVAAIKKLRIAHRVFILPEKFDTREDYLKLLLEIKPDVLAVSSHTPYIERKAALMREVGGELKIVHRHNSQVSTSLLIGK